MLCAVVKRHRREANQSPSSVAEVNYKHFGTSPVRFSDMYEDD